jgi:hypothetical protein
MPQGPKYRFPYCMEGRKLFDWLNSVMAQLGSTAELYTGWFLRNRDCSNSPELITASRLPAVPERPSFPV